MNGFELLARVLIVLVLGATVTGGLLRAPIVEPYKSMASAVVWATCVFACARLAGHI